MHYKNPKNGGIKAKRLNAHKYKKLFQISGEKAKVSQGHKQISASDASKDEDEILAKKSCFDSKRKRKRPRQRVDSDSEEVCFGNRESGSRLSYISSMDGGESGTGLKMGEPSDIERGLEGLCAICMASGELLLYCGQGCGKSFHRSCLDPPLPSTPPGSWYCGSCTKKMKFGVNSVAKQIEFEEYWIPVLLSGMQVEQYCSLLDSNLEALSSCLKNNSSLHDILIQTQECCDHPYLVDPSLRKSFKGDISIDPLDADINVSGKLQLLDKLLLEIKRCDLRVLVLFKSVVSSEKITIGDILDDLVYRRFGQDSYIRIPRKVDSKKARMKKKKDLNMFNNIESGRFICLLDYHNCHSSMNLSCVDVVILFNGDWNPLNDLKALQKIIDSHCDRLRVLRLYSSSTIEEKALILAKQGEILDSNLNNMHWKTCQQLLAWGASDLFNKRQSYTSELSFIADLVRMLSSLLLNKNDDSDKDLLNGSVILNVRLNNGTYDRNMLLFGETEAHTKESSSIDEYLMENEPLVFWTNLFRESHHRMKNPSGRLSRRVQNKFRNPAYWFEGFETETENDKVATTSPCVKTKSTSKGKANSKIEQSKRAGGRGHFGGSSENVNGNSTSGSASVPRAPENVPEACRETDTDEFQRESLVCNLIEQFNHSVRQPAEQVPSTCISDSDALNSSNVQECPNNQTLPVRPPIFQSSSSNPLETELEIIEMDREQATKLHQEKKSVLLSECEKEIAEIRKKYDALIEESEMCVTMQLKDLERTYNLVYANKVLAELMPRFRYDDTLDAPLPEKTAKETNPVKIIQIPASKLRQPVISSSTSVPNTRFYGPSLGLRGPAPHLRSNPSLFSSFNNHLLTMPQPQPSFLEPLPTFSTPQRPSNDEIFQEFPALPELPSELESFYDMGYADLPFLSSNFGNS